MSTVRFCRRFHNMIYYINYSHVGFMLLSLKMQPHSKVDLRIYFGPEKVLLIVINTVQYLFSRSMLSPLNAKFIFCDLKLSLRFEKLRLVFIHACHLVSLCLLCLLSLSRNVESPLCEACLNLLPCKPGWLGRASLTGRAALGRLTALRWLGHCISFE